MSGRRRRALSEAERALWAKVVESVEPLPGRTLEEPPAAPREPTQQEPPAPPPENAARDAPAPRAQPSQRPAPPPLAPLEARFRRRLARGVVAIDARIDLHGLRQEDAHRRLAAFLAGAQSRGLKLVLVITGKGRAPDETTSAVERGVLRRSVPLWLSSPAARAVVVGFEPADPVHGGAGALYVRIRKARGRP